MSEMKQEVQKGKPEREKRFARAALIGMFVMLVILDAVLWIFDEAPDKTVVLVALIPLLAAVFLAHLGQTNRAVWLFAFSVVGAELYLALTNPQTPLEPDDLIGRYLFPILFVVPLALVALKEKQQKYLMIGFTVVVSAFNAFWGYTNDSNTASSADPVFTSIITGLIFVALIGLVILILRNFENILSWFSNMSIRYRLSFIVLVLFIPAILFTGLATVTQARTELEQQEIALLSDANEGLSDSVRVWLQENVNFLKATSEFPAIISMDSVQQKPVLEAIDVNNPHVFLVQTTNTRGINVARNDDSEPKDSHDRVWFLGPMAGNELTFQSLISRTIGEPALAISVPVRQGNGAIVGVLQMALEFSELTKAVGAANVGESGVSFIVDADNILIAHNDQSYFELDELVDFSSHPAVAALRNGTEGLFEFVDESGAEKKAFVSSLDEFGWGLIVTVDKAELEAPIRQMINQTTLILAVMSVVVAVLIWLVLTRTVKPISDLTTLTQEYAAGNLKARADFKSDDEIGQLGKAFNLMADEVGSQTMALQERAREMEASQRVTFAASERTTPEDFLDLLVNLIVDQFDVYHSQIYLVDEARENAVLSQSTGYAGRVLLQRKHYIPLERESLVTRCIHTGEPVLVGNTLDAEGWLANDLLPHTQSELVVPIKVEGEIIGALDIQARVAGRFTEETVPVFESMVEQVAFLYQNNELLENIEFAQQQQMEFVKQLEKASQVAGQLTSILDPAQLLDQAVSMLQSNFNFYHAHIYLVDDTQKNLVVQSGSGHVGVILRDRGHSIPVDAEKSFVATAFRTGQPVRVADTTSDPNWLPNPLLPDTRSEMAVPLITRGQVIGVLDVQADVTGRFTEVDEDTMLTLAGQLATSVDTARLFEDVERSAERDRMRFEIAEALSGDLTPEEVWDVLLSKASGKNTAVTLSLADHLPDDDILITTHRSSSSDAKLTTAPIGEQFKISENPVLAFLEPGEVYISNDVSKDERMNPAIRDYLLNQGVVSLMAAPFALAEGDEWEGMIRISSSQAGYFDQTVAGMYTALIELGTQALESARLREQREEERERFEALVTYAPDAILLLDYETYMWADANKNAEAMFGYTREELLKIGPGDVSPSHQPDGRESGEKAVEMISTAVAGGNTQFEWVHNDKDGNEFNCEIRLALLPGDDKQLLVNITDITERKAAQDTIIQGDKLKSEFLANMSHELRTPLNSIVGYTDVLLMGIDGDLNEEMLLDVEAIKENSSLLLKIINDILDLAKIEAKRVIFELSEVEMKEVFENVARNNAGLMVNKPVEMLIDTDPDLPTIEVDAQRVEQVLNNLVSNAVKFTEEGAITLRAFTEPDWMVLQVEDTGCGMSEDDLQVIFEEFRQADGSQTRTAEGTGLGLAITSRLVNMHSGTINVESEVGKGSTFTVRLPLETKISPEVTVKEPKKDNKQAEKPVVDVVPSKPENAVKKETGSLSADDLNRVAGVFGDELKKVVVSSNPDKEDSTKKSSNSNGKNGSKS